METTAFKRGRRLDHQRLKRFNTGMHTATADLVFARTSGKPGEARGITAFLVPTETPGFKIDSTCSGPSTCPPTMPRCR